MCGKIFAIIIVLIALAVALLASFLPLEHISYAMLTSKFFDIMLPILAVGALLKYLFKCPQCYSGVCEVHKNPNDTDKFVSK